MQFNRLRLAGFKSFVEPTDFLIEPGLTGVVGPNGCGKSNLLEALRWVMGASSAKSLRADGMDEVIFGGSGARAARSHAEVRLEIDNSAGDAPAPWSGDAMIEVIRRIDRGAGSIFRVNGAEARARDVQLLFADGSTGANSPSLVRQGQISELIAAKPANRRRLLEEAAGIAGLHGRRHEAGLRLSVAEANLERLKDVLQEVDAGLARLRREARHAELYRRRSAHIRLVQIAAGHARWKAAQDAWARADTEAQASLDLAADAAREATRTATAALGAATIFPRLREELAVAIAVLQPLAIERDRIERELAASHALRQQVDHERQRIEVDLARERRLAHDARDAVRVAEAALELVVAGLAGPDRVPGLESALLAVEAVRADADRAVEEVATALAVEVARLESDKDRRGALIARDAEAERRRAQSDVRRRQARGELEAVEASVRGLKAEILQSLPQAEAARTEAETALARAGARLASAERALTRAEAEVATTRAAEAGCQDRLRRLQAEASGLARLTRSEESGGGPAVLAQLTSPSDLWDALAAALGDDLQSGLEDGAPTFWAGRSPDSISAPAWPCGAKPMSQLVAGPPQLDVRLAFVALVERTDGPALAKELVAGARLVSREGDLWRWDGFTARADAQRPAARRFEQHARLAAIEAEVALAAPDAGTAADRLQRKVVAVAECRTELTSARFGEREAEAALRVARAAFERTVREAAVRDVKRLSADETRARALERVVAGERDLARDEVELAEAASELLALGPSATAPPDETLRQAARGAAARARADEVSARAALDGARRTGEEGRRRANALGAEIANWVRRAEDAEARCDELEPQRLRAIVSADEARQAPDTLQARLVALRERTAKAESRRTTAVDSLNEAEATAAGLDRAARAAEAAASVARERRAAAVATLEPAQVRRGVATEDLERTAGAPPAEVALLLAQQALAVPSELEALDAHLHTLEAERASLGVVNLRAEEELTERSARRDAMASDLADLQSAATKLRSAVEVLNAEGRERVLAAFSRIDAAFRDLFSTLFDGGYAELRLVESDDALEAGLEIFACPPGKRLSTMSLMSGGEQALTACALIFAVFLAKPSPVCVLDEVDAPLDDANVDRFCRLLDEMRRRTETRFIAITHNPVTMSRMDRLVGVTMAEKGVSRMVSVDLLRVAASVQA